ncbi:beta-glucosidase 12-like [Malus domestica]|uniref:beta-glucosidase 12-like n=1 Tax=Malus domestica TaxID=3750 RepID=UPI003975EA06
MSQLITRRWSVTNVPPALSTSTAPPVSAPLIREPTPLAEATSTVSQVPVSLTSSVSVESLRLKPFVTLFHGDVPQALEDEYGGFLSPRIVNHFKDYAELCYKEFGDRVKHWFTENEPYTFSYMGYAVGTQVPGCCSSWQNLNCTGGDSAIEPYLVAHHLLLAHGAAVELYTSSAPKNNSLPASYVTDSRADLTTELNGVLIGPQAASDWLYVYPKGIHDLVLYTKEKYNDPLIYITENGVLELNNPELSLEEALHDTSRIDYYYCHLCYL